MAIEITRKSAFEPLPGENKLWFDRFLLYRDMEYAPIYEPRNLHFLQSIISYQKKSTLKSTEIPINDIREYIAEYGTRDPSGGVIAKVREHHWHERCRIYDRIRIREAERERAVWERQTRNRFAKLSNKMIDRASDIIAMPIAEKTKSKDGQVIIIKPINVRASDAPAYLKEARELAKFAYQIREEKISEMEAIQVLIEAGWLPPEVVTVAAEGLEDLKAKLLNSLSNWDLENEADFFGSGNKKINGGSNGEGEFIGDGDVAAEEE